MSPLSVRLEAILALLSPCGTLVDVGTDHALIPLQAVARGLARFAIASDLRDPPLRAAQARVARAELAGRVALVREDGLMALAPGAIDAVVMAGMSGEGIAGLCAAGAHALAHVSQLILQPNSDAQAVRRWALHTGFHLREERMVLERGQFFPICAFQRGQGEDLAYRVPGFTEADLCVVGPKLLTARDPVLLQFCARQRKRLGAIAARAGHDEPAELAVWRAAQAFLEHR